MTVYICEGSLEGILSGVYEAWMDRKDEKQVRLELETDAEWELFTEYRQAAVSKERAQEVISAIRKRLSEEVYENIYIASLSQDRKRADKIYRFLTAAFHYGKRITGMLQLPQVQDMFQMCRNVQNEAHLLTGFVRFSETEDGILFGRISPKNAVLPLLALHFADRLSGEHWILLDEKRKDAAVYSPEKGWLLIRGDCEIEEMVNGWKSDQKGFETLWRIFHSAAAIEERKNPICQRTNLPLRYRGYMTEFE